MAVARASRARIALVLGGGGMKGFAHIGVLRALEEYGIRPAVYGGTSIGSLVAAAAVSGMGADEMAQRAEALRRRDLFRINHLGMLMERMHAPAIYLSDPLRHLVDEVAPPGTFEDLPRPLLVNTVDLERASRMVWGLPGLRDVPVRDAVYASCALPGFFPPARVGGRLCVDGGVIDNIPAAAASLGMDAVIAVDVGSNDVRPLPRIGAQGFAAIYMRAATTMMHQLQLQPLSDWRGPPMLLIRPKVDSHWLSFLHAEENIREGYRATTKALEHLDRYLEQPGGVYPRKRMRLHVVREDCVKCGLCVALAPGTMTVDAADGTAVPREELVEWSAADGDFVFHCPTRAIKAARLDLVTPGTPAEGAVFIP
ncbi:MAG: patatin-like phospholipase family protein [Gemmatimonadota bacterium]|nr:patatin-like phospholipase family protein [Gemmatimonadota bacterium]